MEGIIYVTIYLDIIMFICLLFNGAILFLVTYILKQKRPFGSIVSGTILATLFVPIVVYFPQSFFNTISGKILYSIIIIVVTMGIKSVYFLFKSLITFYVVSFIAGGAILSVHYVLEHSAENPLRHLLLYVENVYHNEISLVIIFIGFPLTLFMTKIWSDKLVLQEFVNQQLYNITVYWNDDQKSTTAFLDSGNHLVDPLTNRPVIICDATFMQQFFTKEDWIMTTHAIESNKPELIPFHLSNKFTIIPFQSVASTHYLFAIKPDKLIVQAGQSQFATDKVLVGIQLSSITNDDAYHCLLHPQLLALQRTELVS